jgi:hypothetical protein
MVSHKAADFSFYPNAGLEGGLLIFTQRQGHIEKGKSLKV